MSHPARFDPEDRLLGLVREICLPLPDADEKVSHGRPNFFTRKVFAIYGATVRGDHWSAERDRSVQVLLDADERVALQRDERFFVPAYTGTSGWLGLDLTVAEVDWDEVAELVEASYRNTAGKRLVAELDAREPACRGKFRRQELRDGGDDVQKSSRRS
jgi:hypothetical protein